jgi:hypothetical protein
LFGEDGAVKRLTAMFVIMIVCATARAASLPTVGMEGRIETDLPGTTLEAKPVNQKAPLVLRIASFKGNHYDLRYIGLVPGKHDLKNYLVRSDGSSVADLPSIPVEVAHLLPDDHRGQLVPVAPSRWLFFGGYRIAAAIAVGIWLVLLVPLLIRRKRSETAPIAAPPRPLTLADRLRPLLDRAASGMLSTDEKGYLERLLLCHWQRRLNLTDTEPAAAVIALRQHPEAGALLRSLEDWLYRPPASSRAFNDIAALLEPYRNVADPIAEAAAT